MEFGNKVVGYGKKNGADLKEFFAEDDELGWFTGVLYFSAVEDDGLPSVEKLATPLVARPFVKVDGEYIYGDETEPTSIFDVVLDLFYGEDGEGASYDDVDENTQAYFDAILAKVDTDS